MLRWILIELCHRVSTIFIGDHGDFPNVMNLADVGQLEDLDADPMHLMDIDIISFDSDDMNLDFEEGGGLHHAPDTRNVVGDSCCFGFDWGCSSYYKNVFNPATDKRNNKVSLPSSSQQGSNKRPAVIKKENSAQSSASQQNGNGNFYTLPPAPTGPIEMHTIGGGPTLQTPVPASAGVIPQQFPLPPTAPVAANLQQAQMLYGQLPIAPVGQPAMVPATSALQYQQFLAHQQQMQMQQQQQYMVAYQQAMANPQQQQQFHQYQQQLQMQNQYLAQQQPQQQAAMLGGGGYPQQQYALHAQYAMHPGPGAGGSRPVSTSSYASSNNSHSRPVSSSSYGGTIGAGIGGASY